MTGQSDEGCQPVPHYFPPTSQTKIVPKTYPPFVIFFTPMYLEDPNLFSFSQLHPKQLLSHSSEENFHMPTQIIFVSKVRSSYIAKRGDVLGNIYPNKRYPKAEGGCISNSLTHSLSNMRYAPDRSKRVPLLGDTICRPRLLASAKIGGNCCGQGQPTGIFLFQKISAVSA